MGNEKQNEYTLLYFTSPFCGVCQSAKTVVQLLAMSLEVPFLEQNVHMLNSEYTTLSISMTPAIALVYNTDVVYYTEDVNNLSDLFTRFERGRKHFEKRYEREKSNFVANGVK